MTKQFHPFHIVFVSPWPLLVAASTFSTLLRSVILINEKRIINLILSGLRLVFCVTLWWRDVSRESSFQGFHTNLVINGLRWGIGLFIISEILFFFSFFWTFFHRRLAPSFEIGNIWPPIGSQAINPYQVPLLNTVVLLSSGITVTISHHAIIKSRNKFKFYILITIQLGLYFSCLQAWEYWESSFSFRDSCFGSTFFLATGFHGIHVLVGTIFLCVSLIRFNITLLRNLHHINVEMSIWYWHFVDVVWLFLYSFIYWWAFWNISICSIINFQLIGSFWMFQLF